MSLDQIVHNRVALMLGDALVRNIALEAQVGELNKQVAELSASAAGLKQQAAQLQSTGTAQSAVPAQAQASESPTPRSRRS